MSGLFIFIFIFHFSSLPSFHNLNMSGEEVSSRKPKFFKIMLGNFKLRLPIPPSFEKYISGELGRDVTVLGPINKIFEIVVQRDGNGLFLGKGWQDFVDYYSLQHGELLVFIYNGNSRFDVEIFDKSACEKQEMLFSNEEVTNALSNKSKVDDTNEKTKAGKDTISRSADKAAKAFKTKNPSFTITLKQSHNRYMRIPLRFARENGFSEGLTMNLRRKNGKKIWSVKVHRGNFPLKEGRFDMRGGWRDFWVDNNLEEGDDCHFELLEPMLLEVRIVKRVAKK